MNDKKLHIYHKKLYKKSKRWKNKFKKLLLDYFDVISSREKNGKDYFLNFYLRNNLKYFIDELDFVFYLSQKNKNEFIYFLTRKMMERLLRIEYVLNLQSLDQTSYVKTLLMRSSFRYYYIEKNEGNKQAMNTFRKSFALFNIDPSKYEIDNIADERQIKTKVPIPGMKKLCNKESKINNVHKWYMIYQFYCDDVHGNLISDMIRENNKDDKMLSFYNLPASGVILYVKELCCVIDKYLQNRNKEELDKLIMEVHEFNERYLNKYINN